MDFSPPSKLPPAPDVTRTDWEEIDEHEILAYDSASNTYRATFDSSTDQGGLAIISVIAAISGTPPLELPPLYPSINTDAVESLLKNTTGNSAPDDPEISSTYEGYTVTIHSNGVIAVQPPQEPALD